MSSAAQRLYWKAPYFVKCLMASWNARRLDRQRYGPAYRDHLAMIAEHDRWTAAQFHEYQQAALREIVRQAAEHVPHYQRAFAEAGVDASGFRGIEDLPSLPILEKQIVRADPSALLDQRLDRRQLLVLHTSGTTGTPLDLYRDASLNAAAFAYLDARLHAAAGMGRRHNVSASIGGHLVTEPGRRSPPFWVYNRRWRQLYMSSYHLAPAHLGAYVEALRTLRCEYIEGYPSSIYALARHILDSGLEPVALRACFTLAEPLYDYQREAIGRAFGCRTFTQYGCGEMVVFAAECRCGSMHLTPEFGLVEVVDDDDRLLPEGATGQLLCTSLINRIQPFIRYRLGDLGSLRAGQCECGSVLPMLGHVEGRTDEVLIMRDGRAIGRLDPVFKDVSHIAEAQIVQDDWEAFRVRIVPAPGYTESDGRRVADNLRQRVGNGTVRIETVDAIERTRAGKFKAVVCKVRRTDGN